VPRPLSRCDDPDTASTRQSIASNVLPTLLHSIRGVSPELIADVLNDRKRSRLSCLGLRCHLDRVTPLSLATINSTRSSGRNKLRVGNRSARSTGGRNVFGYHFVQIESTARVLKFSKRTACGNRTAHRFIQHKFCGDGWPRIIEAGKTTGKAFLFAGRQPIDLRQNISVGKDGAAHIPRSPAYREALCQRL
jgi:hypothetical protein